MCHKYIVLQAKDCEEGGGGKKYPNLCDVIYECPLGALGIGHSHPACKINIGEMCLIINTTG